jgi:hypothetical protein
MHATPHTCFIHHFLEYFKIIYTHNVWVSNSDGHKSEVARKSTTLETKMKMKTAVFWDLAP